MAFKSFVIPSLLALAVALTGCVGSEPQRTGTDAGGGDRDGVQDLPRNETGNQTGNQTSIGTVGNATAGNETGNVTVNATGNATVSNTTTPTGPAELSNSTYIFTPTAPDDVTFDVNATYSQLVVAVSSDGFVANLRVVLTDPAGTETEVFSSGLSSGSPEQQETIIPMPALGAWTLSFDGTGVGSVSVTVTGQP